MKAKFTNSTFLILLMLLSVSCKNQDNKEIALADETTELEIPNISDAHFELALQSVQNKDNLKAAEEIQKGKQGLINESGRVILTLKGKDQLDSAVFKLDEMANTLKNGGTVELNEFRETILEAELVIKHNYLVTEDFYVLTSTKNKEENQVRDVFTNNMEALDAFNKDLKTDNKDTAKKLYAEGVELGKEYKQWLEKVKVHNAKTSDFLESEILEGNLPLR
ncbi:hypothetical protein [Flagellimonas sediminis]|uniref:DUF4142 domain-containing protein n=1 Tax=Flagellimonas sediminis TaxID=2696468 RepID=A0A6I5KW17_9FLAO|nr:hypothetical protein [Allomuricauda sediminis]NDV44753.1 hypothetical protein [Allomuricauda sediminis]